MKRKLSIILLSVILILSMVACSKKPSNVNPEIAPNAGENGKENMESERNLTLYYSDADATNLVKKNVTVKLQDKTIEEAIIDKLKEEPNEENIFPVIPKDITILSMKTEDKTVFIDISSENLNGGSTQEQFMIGGIVMSLTELENIDKVQFLVDGNKAESLMGHFSIEEPYTREDIGIPIVKY